MTRRGWAAVRGITRLRRATAVERRWNAANPVNKGPHHLPCPQGTLNGREQVACGPCHGESESSGSVAVHGLHLAGERLVYIASAGALLAVRSNLDLVRSKAR